jgi:mRNA interferase MazF
VNRGDLVTIAMQGDFGKPRPALIIQADQFETSATVTVLPITSKIIAAPLLRINIHPDQENGLQKASQVMVDKAMTVKRDKVKPAFGRLTPDKLIEVDRCLAIFLGIAK